MKRFTETFFDEVGIDDNISAQREILPCGKLATVKCFGARQSNGQSNDQT